VLLHGFAESSHIFRFIIDDLAEKFKCVIAIDFIGFGLSDKPGDFKYNVSMHVGTVLKVLKEKEIEGCHFYAHGMGNAVLCELISRQLRRELPNELSKYAIQSATFTNGNMILDYAKPSWLENLLLNRQLGCVLGHLTIQSVFKRVLRKWSVHQCLLDDDSLENMYLLLRNKRGNLKMHKTFQYHRDLIENQQSRWLPDLKIAAEMQLPIHLCWGNCDLKTPPAMAAHLRKRYCTNAHLSWVKDAGHFPE
jgi:pimeloyl-ACP methyl ester carboxylesterase